MKRLVKYFIIFSALFAQDRVIIEGEAEYKFSDNETLIEAKALCYNMALRNAVESYQIFVSSITDIKNFQLRNDIIQTLSTGYLENLTILEENIDKNENSVYYKLKAYVRPREFREAIKIIVSRRNSTSGTSISSGKYLTVLNVLDNNNQISIVYAKVGKLYESAVKEALENMHEYGDDQFDMWYAGTSIWDMKDFIFITFLDIEGFPIGGKRLETETFLMPGEVRRSASVDKPPGTSTYEVRVTK